MYHPRIVHLCNVKEVAPSKRLNSKAKTRIATVNFKLRAINQGKQRTLKGNGDTRKFHTKP